MSSNTVKAAANNLLGGDSLQPSSVQRGLNSLLPTPSSSSSSSSSSKSTMKKISPEEGEAIVKNMISYMDGSSIKRGAISGGNPSEVATLTTDDFQAISNLYLSKKSNTSSSSESSTLEEKELFKLCLAHFNGNVQEMFTALNSNLALTPGECSQVTKFINGE